MSEEERTTQSGDVPPQPEAPQAAVAAEPIVESATPAPQPVQMPPVPPAPPMPEIPSIPPFTPPSGPTFPVAGVDTLTSDEDRLMAALAWVGLLILQIPLVSLVLLVAEGNKNRPFQRFHAVNSIVFWVAGFVYEIIAVIVYLVLTVISFGCLGIFLWVIFFFPHLLALYYAYQAYQGKQSDIPFISQLARGQGWV